MSCPPCFDGSPANRGRSGSALFVAVSRAVSRGSLAAAALTEDGTSSRWSVRHTRRFMPMFAASDVPGKDRAIPRKSGAQAGHLLAATRLGARCDGRARSQDRHRRLHRHRDDAWRPGPRPSSCRPSQAVPLLADATTHQTSRTLPSASPTQRHVWARKGVVVRARTRALRRR